MKRTTLYQFLFAGAILCTLLVTPFGLELWSQGDNDNSGLQLAAPSFVKQARAQDVSAAAIETVLGEAGFSAYFRKDAGINLDNVEGLYRTVEDRTDTYIIGSIDIDDYGEGEAPHVIITTDGWVLAYYPAFYNDGSEVPLSRSIDMLNYDGIEFNTKLKAALNKVTPAIGVPANMVPTYYHFMYPNATHLTIVGEFEASSSYSSFEVKIPGDFNYEYIGWAYHSSGHNKLYFNDVQISEPGYHYGTAAEERIYNVVSRNTLRGYLSKVSLVFLYNKE